MITTTNNTDTIKTSNLLYDGLEYIDMCGSQKGRVGLARTIYRIFKYKSKFITLDEVDKSIQSEMVVEIMNNIFDYMKSNQILTFVIAHNPDVKK